MEGASTFVARDDEENRLAEPEPDVGLRRAVQQLIQRMDATNGSMHDTRLRLYHLAANIDTESQAQSVIMLHQELVRLVQAAGALRGAAIQLNQVLP